MALDDRAQSRPHDFMVVGNQDVDRWRLVEQHDLRKAGQELRRH
jgi:hypothetical protein